MFSKSTSNNNDTFNQEEIDNKFEILNKKIDELEKFVISYNTNQLQLKLDKLDLNLICNVLKVNKLLPEDNIGFVKLAAISATEIRVNGYIDRCFLSKEDYEYYSQILPEQETINFYEIVLKYDQIINMVDIYNNTVKNCVALKQMGARK